MAADDDRRCLAAVRDDLAALLLEQHYALAATVTMRDGVQAIIEAIDQHFNATSTPADPRRN
jgi:hypothetical protein